LHLPPLHSRIELTPEEARLGCSGRACDCRAMDQPSVEQQEAVACGCYFSRGCRLASNQFLLLAQEKKKLIFFSWATNKN
jgi:hypothetical protein